MEKYDAAFSDLENRLIYEARMIPPNMETIENLLQAGADLNKTGAERNVFLTILEYYGEYVDENGDVKTVDSSSEIKINSITSGVDDKVFKAPSLYIDITRFVKLILRFIAD